MFKGMRYVYAVYKEQSFTKASEKLFVSQPSLSASIKRIEKEIGTPLFERGYSPIRLTDMGKQYIETTEKILKLQNDFLIKLNDTNSLKSGKITIGGSNYISSYVIPKIASCFSQLYPGIEIHFVESNSVELYKQVQNEDIDLIIDSFDFNKDLYKGYPLSEEKILLAVPYRNKINDKLKKFQIQIDCIYNETVQYESIPSVSIKLFKNENFILLKNGNDMYKRASSIFQESNFEPKVAFYLDQLITAYALTSSEMGVCFVTDTLFKYSKFKNNVILYKINGGNHNRTLYIAHKKNKYVTKAMSAFIQTAQDIIKVKS